MKMYFIVPGGRITDLNEPLDVGEDGKIIFWQL